MTETNPNFWECECMIDYIKPKKLAHCPHCNQAQDDMPDARQEELLLLAMTGLVWFMPDVDEISPVHATLNGMTTLCGRPIPRIHHPASPDEVIECETCKGLLYPVGEKENKRKD